MSSKDPLLNDKTNWFNSRKVWHSIFFEGVHTMTTPSTKSPSDATETNMSRVDRVENVNTFRRILPQVYKNVFASRCPNFVTMQMYYLFIFEFYWVFIFFRTCLKLLGALAKNLIIINIGEFIGFSAITISSLTGLSKELNPDETVQITAAQASWLCEYL